MSASKKPSKSVAKRVQERLVYLTQLVGQLVPPAFLAGRGGCIKRVLGAASIGSGRDKVVAILSARICGGDGTSSSLSPVIEIICTGGS
jgi:hypothetical protein